MNRSAFTAWGQVLFRSLLLLLSHQPSLSRSQRVSIRILLKRISVATQVARILLIATLHLRLGPQLPQLHSLFLSQNLQNACFSQRAQTNRGGLCIRDFF